MKTSLLGLALMALASHLQAHRLYNITDLGTLPNGKVSYATAINNRGQITGYAEVPSLNPPNVGSTHAFLYQYGRMQDIGALDGETSVGLAINDHGQIVGQSTAIPGIVDYTSYRAFLYTAGHLENLGIPGGGTNSVAVGINNRGIIIGNTLIESAGNSGNAFIYDGHLLELFLNSRVGAINDRDEVVGNINGSLSIWRNGKILPLPTSGASTAMANAISHDGHVVGESGSSNSLHAFLYTNGKMKDLGSLPIATPSSYFAYALNSEDTVVGEAISDSGQEYAFVYFEGSMHFLNSFVKNMTWTLTSANGINDCGQIVGAGLHNGVGRGFLATPVR
jgi:probable HAF family extracellular repeat protein